LPFEFENQGSAVAYVSDDAMRRGRSERVTGKELRLIYG